MSASSLQKWSVSLCACVLLLGMNACVPSRQVGTRAADEGVHVVECGAPGALRLLVRKVAAAPAAWRARPQVLFHQAVPSRSLTCLRGQT